jgi:predicted nucleotidyltransferase
MKPSEALAAHRDALRQLVSRYGLLDARIFGSAVNGTDTEDTISTCLWTQGSPPAC